MSSKETPKKVYSKVECTVDPSSCRFCGAGADASHCKNIFKPLNQHLLKIAKKICGHPILNELAFTHLICRPCECRLKNTVDFQKVMVEAEQVFLRTL